MNRSLERLYIETTSPRKGRELAEATVMIEHNAAQAAVNAILQVPNVIVCLVVFGYNLNYRCYSFIVAIIHLDLTSFH